MRVPLGRDARRQATTALAGAEGPRGTSWLWLRAGEGGTVDRVRLRSASFANWPVVAAVGDRRPGARLPAHQQELRALLRLHGPLSMPLTVLDRLLRPLRRGPLTRAYPARPLELPAAARGLPELDTGRCDATAACVTACPTGAIAVDRRCVAAGRGTVRVLRRVCDGLPRGCHPHERQDGARGAFARGAAGHPMTSGGRHDRSDGRDRATRCRGRDWTRSASCADVIAARLGRSLHVRHLDAGSCNGCDWEIAALLNPIHDVQRLGIDFVASPRHADLLLVTGVMTRNLEEAALRTYEAMPEPRLVVAVGACAISGGVFAGTLRGTRRHRRGAAGRRLHPGLPASPRGAHPRSAAGHGTDGAVRRVITRHPRVHHAATSDETERAARP